MSIKRTTYKGFSFPDDDTYLNVRPAFTRMCMENRAASKLLSALIFKWELSPDVDIENVTSFCIQLTQAEIIKAMCDEATAKTIHDVAMPCLHLFGYADVDESTYPFTYTVHVDRVREGLAYCKQGMKQLEEVLIVWAGEKGLATIDGERLNKKKLYIALEEVLIIIRESSNSIGKSSNSRRGRKPSAQAASVAQKHTPKNTKNTKKKKEEETHKTAHAVVGAASSSSQDKLPGETQPPRQEVVTPLAPAQPAKTKREKTPAVQRSSKPEPVTVSDQEQKIIEMWCSLFKRPIPINDALIKAAKRLVPCEPTVNDFKDCRGFCYTTNPEWFGLHGVTRGRVTLKDVADYWEGWQSSLEQPEQSEANYQSKKVLSVVSGRQQVGKRISSFDDENYTMDNEFYPSEAERKAAHAAR